MLLAILSDTHLPRGQRAIPPECLAQCARADAILHAGDLIEVAVIDELRSLGPPLHAVHGNVDSAAVCALLPARLEVKFGAVRVGIVHVPGPPARRLRDLRSAFPGCDAVVFGHTHLPEHAEDRGFQIFNPGSPTERRRAPRHTMGVARVSGPRIDFRLLALD